jgi:hypothetical protein
MCGGSQEICDPQHEKQSEDCGIEQRSRKRLLPMLPSLLVAWRCVGQSEQRAASRCFFRGIHTEKRSD